MVLWQNVPVQLLEFLEKPTRIIDTGDPLDIIYLDFEKAFDKVHHKRLLGKMRFMGIKDTTNISTCSDISGGNSKGM